MTTPACIANAVADALDIGEISLPITPVKLAAILHGDEPPPPAGLEQAPRAAPAYGSGKGTGMMGEGSTFVS
ncbi:MAG: hypothetical protein HYU75_10265, partial [Betaproteobacteria bacterium]|nr:hypothetical protein [Betaproteobacteria bacterium]